MAAITPATTYPTGPFPIEEHGRNVYSNTTGEGVMSEVNGNLDATNLHASFTAFQAEHVFPEAHLFGRQETIRQPRQCFGDVFGGTLQSQDDVEDHPERLVTIPGANLRIYLPQTAAVLWQWSYFVAPQRWVVFRTDNNDGLIQNTGLAMTAAKVDGTLIQHTIRPLPLSLGLNEQAEPVKTSFADAITVSNINKRVFSYAGRTAVYRDMAYLSPTLQAGWHDIAVCLYLENLQRTDPLGENLPTIYATREEPLDTFASGYAALITNAAVFGVTTPRALVLAL